jgi:glucan biosynthesis protein
VEAQDEAELAAEDRRKRETQRHQVGLQIAEKFRARNQHLQQRFPALKIDETDDLSLRLALPADEYCPDAMMLEFQVEVSHSGSAFHIHCRSGKVDDVRADRISFAERNLDMERVERFVERKILDFVRAHMGEDADE